MLRKSVFIVSLFLILFSFNFIQAQTVQPSADTVMVLPFENTSGKPEFNWVGESFAASLSELLASGKDNPTGLNVIANEERKIIQQGLKIPLTNLPSLATSLVIARQGKASILVIGKYNITPAQGDVAAALNVTAKLIRVNEGHFLNEQLDNGTRITRDITLSDALANLQTIEGQVAYSIMLQHDRSKVAVVQNKVIEIANKIPAKAFEAYIKGLLTPEFEVQTREGYFKNAMRLYTEAKPDEVYADAALELGHLFFNQKQNQNAIDYFSKVPADDPHYAESIFYTGLIYWQQKDYEQALAVLRPLADDLKIISVYNTIGAIAIQASRAETKNKQRSAALLNEGLESLKKAAESESDETLAKFNYGVALFLNEKYAEAAQEFRPVLASNQRDGEAYYLLSKALEKTGDTKASEFDNQARIYLPNYAKVETEWQRSKLFNDIALRVEQPPRKDFVSVILTNKQNAAQYQRPANETESLLEQSRAFYKAGRDDEALQLLGRYLISEPTSAQGYLLVGNIQLRRAEMQKAVDALRTALFYDNNLIDAHISLGKIFLEKKDCQQAQTFAAQALQLDENNQEAIALQRQTERCTK